MIVNSSSKEKTIKSMMETMSSDNWVLEKTQFFGNYNNKCIVAVGSVLDNFNDYFEQYLEEANVPERFYYQPAAFAENYYGTPDLDFLVLYFAKMSSLFEFNKPKITVLPRDRLLELNKIIVSYKKQVEDSIKNPTPFIQEEEISTRKNIL